MLFIRAGAKTGLGAEQLAAKFAEYAETDPEFHVRAVSSIQVKASALKVSLAKYPDHAYQIPDSGMMGTSVRDKKDRPKWQRRFNRIYAHVGGDTGTLKGALDWALEVAERAIEEGWV
jgi:translation elongation factor EF-1alpha